MKKINLLLVCIIIPIMLYCQQSISCKMRPKNISLGIIKEQSKSQIVIPNVPSYFWHHGCAPAALGMVVGYYDIIGFDDLISGDASVQTASVNRAIANSEHFSDYAMPLDYFPDIFTDKSELGGAHESNCLADYIKTSWSSRSNPYGASWSSEIAQAFIDYIYQQNHHYKVEAENYYFTSLAWSRYMNEINNNRPVVLLVDSDGNGASDHFVTGIGYDASDQSYAVYDTWDNQIHWYLWRITSLGTDWGVFCMNTQKIYFRIAGTPFPPNAGSIHGETYYLHGQTASITAIPNPHFQFVNWTEAGNQVSTNATYSFMAGNNRTLTAIFEPETYRITAVANPVASGSVYSDTLYKYGDTAYLTASPEVGFEFTNWSEGGIVLSTENPLKLFADNNRRLVANFERKTYNILTASMPENGGEVFGSGIYFYGDSAYLTAVPDVGFCFVNWTDDDIVVNENPQYSFLVEENRSLLANFMDLTSIPENITHPDIEVYPNPANGIIYIDLKDYTIDPNAQICVSLLDNNGKKVQTISQNPSEGLLKADISSFPQGIYYVQVVRDFATIQVVMILKSNK